MKALLTSIMTLICILLYSQNFTITMTKNPCNKDGILVVSGLNPQLHKTVYWYTRNSGTTHDITGTTDQFDEYPGGYCSIAVVDHIGNTIGWARFESDLPFKVDFNYQLELCPKPSFVTANITGGVSPFMYEWKDEDNNIISTINPLEVKKSGSFGYKITDGSGCIVESEAKDTAINIHLQSPFTYELKTTQANCTNGTAEIINLTGGLAPYSFKWYNGATTQNINSLSQGSYTVEISDANGCAEDEWFYIQQAKYVDANMVTKHTTCANNDGELEAFASGGTAPYTYTWSHGPTTQKISQLAEGYYLVDIIDSKQCSGTGWGYISTQSPVQVTIGTITESSCSQATGSAQINISGGLPPYNISWNTFPIQTSTTLSNVPGGTYRFKVVDANNCERTGVIVIPFENAPSLLFNTSPELCKSTNGTAQAIVSGGTSPFTFQWSNSSTQSSIQNQSAGSYFCTLTDAKQCIVIKSAFIHRVSPLSINFVTKSSSCIFTADGEIQAVVSGGKAPYKYYWTNSKTTSKITNLLGGDYWLSVEDANGCFASGHVLLDYDLNTDFCYCTLKGKVYYDANQNCIQNQGDYNIPNVGIRVSGRGITFSNSNGEYEMKVPTGNYLLDELAHEVYPLSSCQNNDINIQATAASGCVITNNFSHTIDPIRDIHISQWMDPAASPGFVFNQSLIISNDGTPNESAMIAQLKDDGQIGVPLFNPNNIFLPTGSNTYDASLGAFIPAEIKTFNVQYQIPANIPLLTDVWFDAIGSVESPLTKWRDDNTPWNNKHSYKIQVNGSYDPNYIQVLPQGIGAEGAITLEDTVLEYRVHFQNEGTYYTRFVNVDVDLDSHLDWSTIRPIYSTHKAQILVTPEGKLKYSYNPIKLYPKNWDESLSSGFFTFSVRMKKGTPIGTKLSSKAEIFFDYNAPITTNDAINTIVRSVGTSEPKENSIEFNIYPNPNEGDFYVPIVSQKIQSAKIEVFDLLGKRVYDAQYNLIDGWQNLDFNLSQVENGMYFLQLSALDGSKQTKRFEIIK